MLQGVDPVLVKAEIRQLTRAVAALESHSAPLAVQVADRLRVVIDRFYRVYSNGISRGYRASRLD